MKKRQPQTQRVRVPPFGITASKKGTENKIKHPTPPLRRNGFAESLRRRRAFKTTASDLALRPKALVPLRTPWLLFAC